MEHFGKDAFTRYLFSAVINHQAAFEVSWILYKHLFQKVVPICEEGFMFLTFLKPRCRISHIHSFSCILFCSKIQISFQFRI